LARWKSDDPIARAAAWLTTRGVPAAALDEDRRAAAARIAQAVAAAESAPWPDPLMLFKDVQDVGAPS
jgi:pyruvate dehydrogenase E1 component alpha subunit